MEPVEADAFDAASRDGLAVPRDSARAVDTHPGDEAEAGGTVHRIARPRRLPRREPDGPESRRPSDVTTVEPMALHPHLDANGVLRNGEEGTRLGDTAT